MKFKLSRKVIDKLWWLLISVDYDYSRVTIADHAISEDKKHISLWLEDKNDFKNILDECLQLDILSTDFAKVIKQENLNSYLGTKVNPKGNYVMKVRIEIAPAIQWYENDATLTEQQWAREAALKGILAQLVESETNFTE